MPSRALTVITIVVAGVALYALLGFLAFPPIARLMLEQELSERLGRLVTIEQVRFDPFELTLEIIEGAVAGDDEDPPLLAFTALRADLQVASVLAGGPIVEELRLEGPRLHLVRYEDGRTNYRAPLAHLMPREDTPDGATAETQSGLPFSISNIQLRNGQITLVDQVAKVEHQVTDLALALPFVSTLPAHVDAYVQPMFHAVVNGTPLTLAGYTLPFAEPRSTAIGLNLADLAVEDYLAYLPDFKLEAVTGRLDTELSIAFRQAEGRQPTMEVTGRIRLTGVEVRDSHSPAAQPAEPFLRLPHLEIMLQSADVLARTVHVQEIRLEEPALQLVRQTSGHLALPLGAGARPVATPTATASEGSRSEAQPPRLAIDVVRVTDGRVTFRDEAVAPPFQTQLSPISIVLEDFNSDAGHLARIEAALSTGAGERLHHRGQLSFAPLVAEGFVELQQLALAHYRPYLRQWLNVDVAGRLDASFAYRYAGETGLQDVSALTAALTTLRIRDPRTGQELVQAPTLRVQGGEVDVLGRAFRVHAISSVDGRVSIQRHGDESVNLAALLPPAGGSTAGPPWEVEAGRLVLSRYRVSIEDRRPSHPVSFDLAPLSVRLQDVSTTDGALAQVSLETQTDRAESLELTGRAGLAPLSAELDIRLDGLQLPRLQPYWEDRLALTLGNAALFMRGHLSLIREPAGGGPQAPALRFTGEASLTNVAAYAKDTGQDLLKWNSLYAGGVTASTHPSRLQIDEVALTDFSVRVEVREDGTLNLQHLWRDPPATEGERQAEVSETESPSSWAVQRIALQGGQIEFHDRYIAEHYRTRLTEMAGRISDVRLHGERPAEVNLRGKLNDRAPVEVTGHILPAGARDLFVNLTLESAGIALPPLTPYAEKYAGYAIAQGELAMRLQYRIDERRVQGQNELVLKQFELGRPVGEDVNLPVRLAVSLLKDRQGQIELDIPVHGALDDPEFSVWGVIGEVVKNLLTKAVTSPFQLIGALFGSAADAEEVRSARFGYGSAELSEGARDRLRTLARALAEHPAFRLKIVPHVDVVQDREALRWNRFERKLQVQKAQELSGEGAPRSPEEIRIEPDEYARYLRKAYQAEDFPKPRNLLGLPKGLEVPEMEKLILTHIQVTEDDLQALARRRAQHVKRLLVQEQIAPERLIVADAALTSVGQGGSRPSNRAPQSRVDFVIQP